MVFSTLWNSLWSFGSICNNDGDKLGQVQQRVTKIVGNSVCEEKLTDWEIGLFTLEKVREGPNRSFPKPLVKDSFIAEMVMQHTERVRVWGGHSYEGAQTFSVVTPDWCQAYLQHMKQLQKWCQIIRGRSKALREFGHDCWLWNIEKHV